MTKAFVTILSVLLLLSCSTPHNEGEPTAHIVSIYPDYTNTVLPPNIAPPNFVCSAGEGNRSAALQCDGYTISIAASKDSLFIIPPAQWKKLAMIARGKEITVEIFADEKGKRWQYKPFTITIAEEEIDPVLCYRLIEPGYELWSSMGIYQTDLTTARRKTIFESRLTDHNCVNCHSFAAQDPDRMLFHLRANHAGTLIKNRDRMEVLDTKTEQTLSNVVYPSWHPTGRFVAFSVNKTGQVFLDNHPNRIEVLDKESDVVIYDVEKRELFGSPLTMQSESLETFPTFSADGKRLYFCSAEATALPDSFQISKYNLCSIAFDPDSRLLGNTVDTLYNAKQQGKSVSFPRLSPDGNYLLYTVSAFGTFSIWHRDADLRLLYLESGEEMDLSDVNSEEAESYHSWSSNSRWFVFSSRRDDGLYTRPYMAYVSPTGTIGKAFAMPQRDPTHYRSFMKSYNIPELVKGEVNLNAHKAAKLIRAPERETITFREQ